jgi:hypothetical protein
MKRTHLQNKSIHSWFTEASRELNNAGIDFKVLVSGLKVDATPELVKSVFRQIGYTKFSKKSTTELTTKEFQECWEEMNRLLANVGIHCPYHSQENTEIYLNSFIQ